MKAPMHFVVDSYFNKKRPKTMTSYIQLLASDLLRRFGNDLSRVAVVFPNKRASLFLNRELARQAALGGDNTSLWSPSYITISDLFRRHSTLKVADQILLVCRLYDVFRRCTGFESETLDHFYGWGLLLLSDFDDLDKNMADAAKVFQIVTDLHELDTDDYLNDNQRKALKDFFHTFNDGHTTMLREKFLQLWSNLHNIYTTFREELRSDGLAYEGMLYRDVCEQADLTLDYDHYCFVGFNMLQQVEQTLFTRLKQSGKALFYWDYDNYYLNSQHEAGHFIGEYISRFPDALIDPATGATIGKDNFHTAKSSVTYISAPTENLQARYVHDWLLENDRWKAGARTAIVMCDENLLQTIIRSLPEEVREVNITTGYPLAQSPMVSMLQLLIELQTEGLMSGTDKYRLRQVNSVLSHPFARIFDEQTHALCLSLNNRKIYYPTRSQLTESGTESLALLFADVDAIRDISGDVMTYNARMTTWLMQIVQHIARQKDKLSPLDSESLFRIYQILQRLLTLTVDNTLNVDIVTYRRLLMQIVATTTVPYHGEPVAGVQIMGVLETRCLDFDHVLVLSCNEGNMPKGVNDSSFIPHSVRMVHGMTTVENKVGIYSYYFHRLLQRAGDVTLTYNSSTEGLNSGEMSRFMLQLMVESGIPVVQRNLQVGQGNITTMPAAIEKSDYVQQLMSEKFLNPDAKPISPSSLGVYLRCQKRYYYQHIMLLNDDDSDIDEMDNKMFGNVFHKAAELAYNSIMGTDGTIGKEVIAAVLKDKSALARFVDDAFKIELFHIKDKHNRYVNGLENVRPEFNGLQIINRKVILKLLEDLLKYDMKYAPFRLIGNETYVSTTINVNADDDTPQPIKIGGIIDRLDVVRNASGGFTMRVVDYKTGFSDIKPFASIEEIFDPKNIDKHSDYYLQAMLYSYIISGSGKYNHEQYPVSPALMYVQKTRTDGYTPVLSIADAPVDDFAKFKMPYLQSLSQLISDILNSELPFAPTDDPKTCANCPFADMCGI